MSSSLDEKYNELYDLIINHKWEDFKLKLSQYFDVVDVNARDKKNNYLLTYAVIMNKSDIVKSLLEFGAKIDIVDNENRSVIYHAINLQYNDILDILLEENKSNIGISILHIKDKDGKIPVHYAVEFENEYALNKILEHNGNLNAKDNQGYNALHLAIYSRNVNIIEKVIKNIPNINTRCNTGENSLHIAANLQVYDICKLLVKGGIDINAQDFDHEFTALHYVVTLGNLDLTKLLLIHDADPNVQDIYGNTPIHYAITENSYACVMELTSYNYSKYSINFNLWNIDSKIPIHLFFLDFNISKLYYIDILIDKSSMTFQDSSGNNCLHYLCMNNLWIKYIDVLEHKKLDIFSKNINGLSAIDYVNENDMDRFLNVVSKSYINRLKRFNIDWKDNFDKICSLDFNDLTPEDKKKINSANNQYEFEKECLQITNKKIKSSWKKIQKGELCVKDMSFPLKGNSCKITTDIGVTVSFCTYTGSTLDVLIGLMYILTKHKSACSTLNKNYANNTELCKFYKSLGIMMNNRCEFLNFEIVWIHFKLYIMDTFYDLFKKCLSKNTKFIIIPVGIELKNGSHANYIIYDKELNEVERFEPHGSTTPPGLNYNPVLLDDILEKRFDSLNMGIKYIRPKDFLPKIGFQLMDASETSQNRIGDPGGFCALWSLWYTDMRLTYPSVKREKLVKYLMKNIKLNNMSFRNLIRNYSQNIIILRDELLSSAEMDVNDWLNDNYNETQLANLMKGLNNKVSKVMV